MSTSDFWPKIHSFLSAEWSATQLKESALAIENLDKKMAALAEIATHSMNQLNLEALALARRYASNTLKHVNNGNEEWDQCVRAVDLCVQESVPLSVELIKSWNQILTSEITPSGFRENDQSLCERNLISPREIPHALVDFEKMLEVEEEPLVKASRIYQWLITIHPFPGANGRTARLAADFILIQNGYLPLVFPSALTSFVALYPSNPTEIHPFEAFQTVQMAVERSNEILLLPIESPPPHQL